MKRMAIAGAAHPHVEYVTAELAMESAEFELVGVSDTDPALARRYADPHGAPTFADHREMLAAVRPDVVVVAGVYGDRGRVVVDALQAGCDVLADKPMCTGLAELDAIEQASSTSGRTVSLLLEKREYPETVAALEFVESGGVGDVVGIATSAPHKLLRATRPSWFFDPDGYGGLLGDLAVHDIDAALLFAPAVEGTIRGATTAPLPDVATFDRFGTVQISSQEALVTNEVSWLTPAGSDVHGDYRMRVIGTAGTVEVQWARGRVLVTTDSAPTRELELPAARRPAQTVLRRLAHDEQPDVDTAASVFVTRLALLAQWSAENGSTEVPWRAPLPAAQR